MIGTHINERKKFIKNSGKHLASFLHTISPIISLIDHFVVEDIRDRVTNSSELFIFRFHSLFNSIIVLTIVDLKYHCIELARREFYSFHRYWNKILKSNRNSQFTNANIRYHEYLSNTSEKSIIVSVIMNEILKLNGNNQFT